MARLNRCSAPFYVQFELTERCNNRCFFCYNEIGDVGGRELPLADVKRILTEMATAGVFRVNFNGGEPLARDDFFEIAEHAHSLGLQLHMNTNATLVTDAVAERLAPLMKSVCVSLLASNPDRHDEMSGRRGAFAEVLAGMDVLHRHAIGIEVNVCTTMDNYLDLLEIARVAAAHGCYAFCSTRYIMTEPAQHHLLITAGATLQIVQILKRIRQEIPSITDVSLPGPVPYCELPSEHYDALAELNVPCQYGYGLCRVSSTGIVTPCTISTDQIANLRLSTFQSAWQAAGWDRYSCLEHIPEKCRVCDEFSRCRGGCIVYDECLVASGLTPKTLKWS